MAPSNADYLPLSNDEGGNTSAARVLPAENILLSRWKDFCIAFLAFATITLAILLGVFVKGSNRNLSALGFWGSDKNIWTQYSWLTRYSKGLTASHVDDAWSKIVPAHGIVAVDREWAYREQLPDTMRLPSDPSKGVYIIDAYHQLHCLTIMRKSFRELQEGLPLSTPPGHSSHCFDALRQYVTCTAGDTLLYTWGRNRTGDGQIRKCRSWNALSKWAGDNTACYKDYDHPVPLLDHFGHCENHGDGIESDKWLPWAVSHQSPS